jgi:probable F420-dependent oxidoreductase
MKIGITLPQMGPQATRENIVKTARIAEQEHFDSLWVGDRLLWPLKPQTRYGLTLDGSLPTFYQNVFDPIETLTFVAANTEKIALGTSVIDMLFYNPVVLAKRFATLDVLSQGRAICGLGIGWSKDEYRVSNVPYEHKGERADEFVQALKAIWTDDVVEFKGKYYNIPASKIGPKPIQKPHFPIYLGGFSPNTYSRIAKYADGWLGAAAGPLEYLVNGIRTLRENGVKANRDPNELKIVVLTFPQLETDSTKGRNTRNPLSRTIDDIGFNLRKIKEIGIDHLIFGFIGGDLEQMVATAKQLSEYAR